MTDTLSSPMPPQRQSEIRDMLTSQVAHDTGTARTAALNQRPTWRPRLRPLAAAALVATAVTGVFLATDVGNPPPSYATWTAVPQTAPGAGATDTLIHQWASTCTDLGVGGIGIEGVASDKIEAAQRDVLVDRRGDFTYCVDVALGNGTSSDPLVAISGIRADTGPEADDTLNTMWGTVYDKPVTKPSGGNVLVLGGDLQDSPPDPQREDATITSLRAYQLYGLAGPDVESVKILLANGTAVTATVQHGLWGAWWPAEKGTASGTRLQVSAAGQTSLIPPSKVALMH